MSRLHHPDAMASKFYLGSDDNELVGLINKEDAAALFQFAMKHIGHLIYCITWDGYHFGRKSYFMRLLLPDFMDGVRIFAKRYGYKTLPEDWYLEFRKLVFKRLNSKLGTIAKEKQQLWSDLDITEEHVGFLNQLNDFLSKKEAEIIQQVKLNTPKLDNRFKDDKSLEIGSECEIQISFFTRDTNGDAAFSTTYYFSSESVQNNDWALLCSDEDWRETGWLPELEHRCCYLMHEVMYHSSMGAEVFNIDSIWVDTRVVHQDASSFGANGWVSSKFI